MRTLLALSMAFALLTASHAGEVTGKIEMPLTCAPAVSPAVVTLEPLGTVKPLPTGDPAEIKLVNQKGLQFVPRVQAMRLGQSLRFSNEDRETHNVHVLASPLQFNETMAAGKSIDITPTKPGLLRLTCDIHHHMRGFVIVSDSPYVATCNRDGKYKLRNVAPGTYRLKVWHEMGDSHQEEITVTDQAMEVATIRLEGPEPVVSAVAATPVRPWPEVIDRISVLLACSLEAAKRPDQARLARKLAEDAYFIEFELSQMEVAVRNVLGRERAGEVEGHFRKLWPLAKNVAEGTQTQAQFAEVSRLLLLDLVRANDDLSRKGVTDRTKIFAANSSDTVAPTTGSLPETRAKFARALERVREVADAGQPDDAASAMADLYFAEFEPIEAAISIRRPLDVATLEQQYSQLRGEIGIGLKGEKLGIAMASLRDAIEASLAKSDARPVGSFGAGFAASSITILREGVEVILLLTMLLALASKTGQAGASRAIGWGVAWAVVASGITALALNRLVTSSQGRTRELLEGGVMLAAAGVLFYVSYWLVSQSQAKRWNEFLKQSIKTGGFGTLGLTAFLAVYREGAETALMYQALITGQGGARPGLLGVAAGLSVGVVLLGMIFVLLKRTSLKLPMRTFFKVTGSALFTMAIVFAGNGVFALQVARSLKVTPLAWLGGGVPVLGLHPNVQVLSVQGILLAGAVGAWLILWIEQRETAPKVKTESNHAQVAV